MFDKRRPDRVTETSQENVCTVMYVHKVFLCPSGLVLRACAARLIRIL